MTGALIEGLLGYQTPSGAFRSLADASDAPPLQDETCLFTAQICLILLRPGLAPASPRLRAALDRGLDFVESCACATDDVWFHLYPPGRSTARLPGDWPAELQSTALAWLALLQSGRRSPATARRALPRVIRATRLDAPRDQDPGWVVPGLCRSWPGDGRRDNPVDLVANIHLAACCALAGLPVQAGVIDALTYASSRRDLSPEGLARISPFSASPAEIEMALERAVRAGQEPLVPALKLFRAREFGKVDRLARRPADRPLHCLPGGAPRWFAPSLQLARWLYDLSHGERPAPLPMQPSL